MHALLALDDPKLYMAVTDTPGMWYISLRCMLHMHGARCYKSVSWMVQTLLVFDCTSVEFAACTWHRIYIACAAFTAIQQLIV